MKPVSDADAAWHVYIVRCRDRTLYTGISNDVPARLAQHNAGAGARYTRGRGPVRLVYLEHAGGRAAALRRELAIKRLSAAEKRRLAAGWRGNHEGES